MSDLYNMCLKAAQKIIDSRMISGDVEISDVADYLYKEESNKLERESFVEENYIPYDDEIVSIEEIEDTDLIDISVSGDNLFYANGVLTKNSFGLPATADWMGAIVTSENLMEMNQQLIINLKTRYGAKKKESKSQLVEVEFEKMRYKDVVDGMDDSTETKAIEDTKKTKAKFKTEVVSDWEI